MRLPRRCSTLTKLAQITESCSHPITWLHQICSDSCLSAGDALNCAQDRGVWSGEHTLRPPRPCVDDDDGLHSHSRPPSSRCENSLIFAYLWRYNFMQLIYVVYGSWNVGVANFRHRYRSICQSSLQISSVHRWLSSSAHFDVCFAVHLADIISDEHKQTSAQSECCGTEPC